MKIALGPLLYYWPRETTFAFYDAMASTAVDLVYLGETVCSRRHELRLADWLEIAARLRAAGTPIGAVDLLIGCQALAEDAVLVTHNVREFERIEGLRIEDWTEEAAR